ncbi:hypothetical protein BKI52_17365 [marine bacterium AO1-C]|nr:hypothetical protein BKI52_17365 [marine bacterium AO1-C]
MILKKQTLTVNQNNEGLISKMMIFTLRRQHFLVRLIDHNKWLDCYYLTSKWAFPAYLRTKPRQTASHPCFFVA